MWVIDREISDGVPPVDTALWGGGLPYPLCPVRRLEKRESSRAIPQGADWRE
jgi:hypothetical protein